MFSSLYYIFEFKYTRWFIEIVLKFIAFQMLGDSFFMVFAIIAIVAMIAIVVVVVVFAAIMLLLLFLLSVSPKFGAIVPSMNEKTCSSYSFI